MRSRKALVVRFATVMVIVLAAGPLVAGAMAGPAAHGATHFACSKPNSAKLPCRFSTPSGNIRCLWTPVPNSVACELVATGRGYSLRPTGKAKALHHVSLPKHAEALPTSQQLVFPQSLSCRDTRTTMTCNQDFGLGFFKLAAKGSRSR
jgi:hypothetical protein